MPLPTDLVPVNKPAVAPLQSGLPKDLVPVNPVNKPRTYNSPGTGTDVIASGNIVAKEFPVADPQMAKVELSSANDDQKQWLKDNATRLTPEQFDHSLNVFTGNAEGSNFLTHGQYYFDDKGIPQQIKMGQEAPPFAV